MFQSQSQFEASENSNEQILQMAALFPSRWSVACVMYFACSLHHTRFTFRRKWRHVSRKDPVYLFLWSNFDDCLHSSRASVRASTRLELVCSFPLLFLFPTEWRIMAKCLPSFQTLFLLRFAGEFESPATNFTNQRNEFYFNITLMPQPRVIT